MTSDIIAELAPGQPIMIWLTLGPFVVKTGPHFEREYLYERERILDVDYLAECGGESTVKPEPGAAVTNPFVGPAHLEWALRKGPDLEFSQSAGAWLYETVQRNCVYYAAAYVQAPAACSALLDAYHSGMKAWVNGELVWNEPYGVAKGLRLTQPSRLVRLRKGPNLLLFKVRLGFISDWVEFCLRQVALAPLTTVPGVPIAIGRVRAAARHTGQGRVVNEALFTGTVSAPRHVIEVTVVNGAKADEKVRVSVHSKALDAEDSTDIVMKAESIQSVRLSLPVPADAVGRAVQGHAAARVHGRTIGADFEYVVPAPPKRAGTRLVLTNFHFDTTYYHEQRVYAMGAFDIVRAYCELHRADPNFRSMLSEIDYLKPFFDVYPEERATLLAAFREGRCEPDAMYNQPNEQTCGGEALVRNFLYGQLFHGRVLGNICRVYDPGDVFGHPNQLSQIARKCGCIGVSWDKPIYNFPPFFRHLALDGVGLPYKRGDADGDEAHSMGLSVTTGSIDQTPPTDWHERLLPQYRQATFTDFMAAVVRACEAQHARLPVTTRDMSLYHAGTALSRVNLKIANRLGENRLIAAEKFATIAALLGAKYPSKALDKAWRQILCGQHHDSITGTHNEVSYIDLMNAYREALELADETLGRSLEYLTRAVDVGKTSSAFVVFNSLAWKRTDVVRATVNVNRSEPFGICDHEGKGVPFEVEALHRDRTGAVRSADVVFVARDVPSLGYRTYGLAESVRPLPERSPVPGSVIENEFYRIEVDPARGGGLSSLYDKQARREVLNTAGGHPGNALAFLEELPGRMESQHEFYTTGLKLFSSEFRAVVECERGPVSATLRARYGMGEICGVIQEITLFKGVRRIEFRTILADWRRANYLACVTFPTNLRGAVPVYDERFGAVVRNESKGCLDFRTHQMVMFSDCAVYAANKWMEYGCSATVSVGRSKYALGMVGLISTKGRKDIEVAEQIERILIRKGVTCTPWFDAGGPRWGSYMPHRDDDRLYTRFRFSIGARGKNTYSRGLLDAQPTAVRRAFVRRLEKDGFACLLVKDEILKENGWTALPVLIVEAKSSKALADAAATILAEFPETATIRLPEAVDATDGRSAVDDYGVAILNEGTYANSVENGGVICMMLAHTCQWYGKTNTFPEGCLVPEMKNHVFRYALYPHAGTWRDANTHHAAYEFNHPLLAKAAKPIAKPVLPPESGFLEVTPKNVILAAMKPYGNPEAAFEKLGENDPARGIMLRLYDSEGTDTEARIKFGKGIVSAWTANLLEQKERDLAVADGAATLHVPPFSIETLGIVPRKLAVKTARKRLGPDAEPVQPVWVRSWEHDAESLPMGYAPVVCSIGREVLEDDGGRTLRLNVNAVNDYTDAAVSGSAEILVPPGWAARPSMVAFALQPLGHHITAVRVTRPSATASGQVRLRHAFDGQVFQDVLEIGRGFELDMRAEHQGNKIVVTLTNPTTEPIDAEVAIVTPLETWPKELVGEYALAAISPRTRGATVVPGETSTLIYKVSRVIHRGFVVGDAYWAVAKLMSNGRIGLARCDNRPDHAPRHAAAWHRELEKRHRRKQNRC
ncbi:MAG TPA: hypothetical protein HPP83_05355 [Candidatus Hydrogenedentes bacterium]|nr:hypothetical protein [Candidatus Hydrogenedentota bacterium]